MGVSSLLCIHGCGPQDMFLNWLLNVKGMLQIIGTQANLSADDLGHAFGVQHEEYLKDHPSWKELKTVYEKSDRQCRLWIVNPDIYKAAGNTLGWGSNAGHLVVRQTYKEMHIRRTMRTPQALPDGSRSYPAIDQLPSTIVVEETQHDETLPLSIQVQAMGQAQSQNLYNQKTPEAQIDDRERNGSSSTIEADPEQKPQLNFGEHRRGILTSFDWRNYKILYPEKPPVYGGIDEVNEERFNKKKDTSVLVGVKHVYDLVQNDVHAGLNYYHYQTNDDPSSRDPKDRTAYLYWLCYKSPVMTRALELVCKYVRELNHRVLVYVDTPWIQCIVVALFRLADFETVTVRPDHSNAEKNKTIADWNTSLEIFVANVNTMGTGVNMHGHCSKGMFLNWMLNVKGMLQIIGRLIRINQKQPVTFHLIKLKNSYYDNIERICCELREIYIFELIKT
ncbi:hypothetical protein FLONG3_6777 [Fusarium longipes]|uniref:Uncharacterized protein n=1 Tax=Fusarium longipes TaxID=694270 RepID=A0A395SJ16_9HYPO|nr:hypothetical protein FLONG3_6777 [Fusarium longipes]